MFSEISGRIGGPVFVLLGLALLGFGLRSGFEANTFAATALRAQGTIMNLNAGGSHPQIHFTTPSSLEVSYPQGGLVFGFRPGETVEVLFDGNDPEKTATVNRLGAVWFATLLLSGLGAVSLLAGMIVWFV